MRSLRYIPIPLTLLPRTARRLLDHVAPPCCVGCGRPRCWLCPPCLRLVGLPSLPLCPGCKRPLDGRPHRYCSRPCPLLSLTVLGRYDGVLRIAILALKYRGCRRISRPLAALLAAQMRPLIGPGDLLVPIPLRRSKRRERGYSQTDLLAVGLAQHLDLRVERKALHLVRSTRDQTRLSGAERLVNLQSAFEARSRKVSGRRVWLIDDVTTTGATLAAAALALQEAGATEVRAAVIALTDKSTRSHGTATYRDHRRRPN